MTAATAGTTVTTQVYRVYIKATPQAIWDAITSPQWNDRYGYCSRGEFDLRPGGKYTAYTNEGMRAMGAPDIAVAGEVIEVDPPRRLVQTWQLMMDEDMAAEGPTRLTYEIEPRDGGVTRLTLIHELDGAPRHALLLSGGLADSGAGGGWNWVLSDLKSLLETGIPLNDGSHQG
jgi:uncharacterized protein YndB with AHSA1/START domain